MPVQDAMKVKEKIISFIRLRGPSLPVQIAKETNLSILFASAFLSELYGEKEINISNLRVGSSPLYYIPGQEPQLERFSQYLKSKEKDAFMRLKEEKFLKDSEQEPAIRVALRGIKDFAIPFKKGEEIYWRYFTIPISEFGKDEEEIEKEETKLEKQEIKTEEKAAEKKIETIFDNSKEQKDSDKEIDEEDENEMLEDEEDDTCDEKEEPKEKPVRKEKSKSGKTKKQNKKRDENFFNKIKEFLEKKGIEILDIRDFQNEEAVLKVKKERKEELLFVFNKKKITEKEILKAYKKASEEKMPYSILSLGEPPKKLNDLIEAIKNLSEMDKIE
jgi:hypothetical protein